MREFARRDERQASAKRGRGVRSREGVPHGRDCLLKRYLNSGDSFESEWPVERARCELNLSRWKRLVRQCSLGDKAGEVLDGLINGFDQGIPDNILGARRWYTPENHDSAHIAADKI